MKGTQRDEDREEIMPGAEDYPAGGAPSVIQLPPSCRRNPYKSGVEEVNVDAMTGAIVAHEHENAKTEA